MNNLLHKFFSLLLTAHCLLSTTYGADVTKIKIKKADDRVKVLVSTDCSQYKDTVLHNPERIVIDFQNSFSHLPKEVASSYSPLLKVRASQYIIEPPVTRVVLDLNTETPYSISRINGGIEVSFSSTRFYPPQKEPSTKSKEKVIPKLKAKTVPKAKPKPIKPTEEISVQPLLPEAFYYNSRGKRDPFRPYLGGQSKDTLVDIGSATIVGIMWSPKERYALVEDSRGRGYILQEGNSVSGGKVLHIKEKEVVFLMHVFGGTKKVTLKVIPKE